MQIFPEGAQTAQTRMDSVMNQIWWLVRLAQSQAMGQEKRSFEDAASKVQMFKGRHRPYHAAGR